MLVAGIKLTGNKVISYVVAFFVGGRKIRVSTLHHKAFCYAVKEGVVKIIVFHQKDKIGAVKRGVVKQLYFNISKAGFDPHLILGIFLAVLC